jgi:hypothetical protein
LADPDEQLDASEFSTDLERHHQALRRRAESPVFWATMARAIELRALDGIALRDLLRENDASGSALELGRAK